MNQALRVWGHGQLLWGEVTPGGWVAGIVVDNGVVEGWAVEWRHVERFRGTAGYADPSVELQVQPLSSRWDDLVVRFPGEAD